MQQNLGYYNVVPPSYACQTVITNHKNRYSSHQPTGAHPCSNKLQDSTSSTDSDDFQIFKNQKWRRKPD